jgi:soluble lytic murein transglycosylase
MTITKRFNLISILSLVFFTQIAFGETLSEEQREVRLAHAHELLGKYYAGSSARAGENVKKINSMIYRWTKERLPAKYRKNYQAIAQAIIDESLKYEFDPVFLMSIIQGESSFNPRQIGGVGEIGLMQIRPSTGQWMAELTKQEWHGKKTLFDPISNIKIGAAYLNYLRDKFDNHAQLYLAAYNMGQRKVASILEQNIWPKDYPVHIMKKYVEFYTELKDRNARQEKKTKKVLIAFTAVE